MTVTKARLDELRIDRTEMGGRKPWGVALVTVAVLLAAAVGAWGLLRPRSPEVVTAAAVELPGGATASATVLNASGYVTARRQATVSSKVTGKVIEVLVEEGLPVEEGQLLARLDPATAEAALRLTEAQATAAASALEETRVRLAEARQDLERATRLAERGVASEADLDRARAQVAALEARLVTQEGELAVARRAVALRRQDLDDTEIRAPFAGVVVSKNAQPGEMISPMSAGGFTRTGICTLVDMDSLEIEVDVNEAYIQRVSPGQPVEAVLDAYPDWKIPARVIAVVPTADRQKATVRVRIGFEGRDPRVLPDMGVRVSFIAPAAEGTEAPGPPPLLIPREALRSDHGQDVVLVVADGRALRRAVLVGAASGGRVEVLSGLAAGERVVVRGPAELAAGDRVRESTVEERR
jgi:HlyD family secretion protein